MNDILSVELLKRIFGCVGAIPAQFGKYGITTDEFLCEKRVSISNENGTIDLSPIFSGKIISGATYSVLLANIGIAPVSEFIMMAETDTNENIFGFWLRYENNYCSGEFMLGNNGKWTQINTLYKLNLTAAFELITQEGLVWQPVKESDKLRIALLAAIEWVDSLPEN